MKNIALVLLTFALLFTGCTTTQQTAKTRHVAYSQIYEQQPVSLLILPPINKSTKVEAKELFYSSLVAPITQLGYYVMPPLLSLDVLKEESAYDSEMFLNASMKKVGEIFGVDAVLFTIINDWSKTAIMSRYQVNIEYILKSTKNDEILFDRIGDITVDVSTNSGSALGDLVGGLLMTALSKEIVGARCSNYCVLSDLPRGKYSPFHNSDSTIVAQPKAFNLKTNTQGAKQAASSNSPNALK